MTTFRKMMDKVRTIEGEIGELENRKRATLSIAGKLREKEEGLVPGETMVREIPQGSSESQGKVGQFKSFYAKYHGSNWITVNTLKKNGEVGLRTATFYEWEKIDGNV
jgi:hypothetical protein